VAQYVIARSMNGAEYYLENIDHNDKAIWIKDKRYALQFENPQKLKDFIRREFPGKGYYVTSFP